jgi:hypothetical protein
MFNCERVHSVVFVLMYWIYLLPSTQQTTGYNGFTTCFDSRESSSGYVQNLSVLAVLLLTVSCSGGCWSVCSGGLMNIMTCHITTSTASVNDQQQKRLSLNVCRMWNLRDTEILNGFPSNISWYVFLNFRSYQCKASHHFIPTSNLQNKKL